MTNVPKDFWNLRQSTFIKFIDQFLVNWVGKSLPYWHAKLVLLVNTLAVNEKYPVVNRDNLTISIQMQLSKEDEVFSQFSAAFRKYSLNFEQFKSKDDPDSFCISQITDSENVVR